MPGWRGMENGQKPEMNQKKKGNRNGNRFQETAPSWTEAKMAKKGPKTKSHGKLPKKCTFGPFFCHFCPCPAWGRSPFRLPFFFFWFISGGFWPFSMPCQPGMIPNQGHHPCVLATLPARGRRHPPNPPASSGRSGAERSRERKPREPSILLALLQKLVGECFFLIFGRGLWREFRTHIIKARPEIITF